MVGVVHPLTRRYVSDIKKPTNKSVFLNQIKVVAYCGARTVFFALPALIAALQACDNLRIASSLRLLVTSFLFERIIYSFSAKTTPWVVF